MKDIARNFKWLKIAALILAMPGIAPVNAEPDPLHRGLPDQLPSGILEQDRFVAFKQTEDTFRAPLGFSYVINGKPLPPGDFSALDEIFHESFFAHLPVGSRIQVRKNASQEEVWDYPVGTRVVHLIEFRSVPKQVYELRIVQKRENGTWAYGVYSPLSTDSTKLELHKYVGTLPAQFSFKHERGNDVQLGLRRINLRSCQHCHAMNSPSRHQYETVEEAGPCGFAPHNPEIKTSWVEKYRAIHGHAGAVFEE